MLGYRQQRSGRNLRGNIQVNQSEKTMAEVQVLQFLMLSRSYFIRPVFQTKPDYSCSRDHFEPSATRNLIIEQ